MGLIRTAIRISGLVLGVMALLALVFVGYVQVAWDRPLSRPVVALNAPRDADHVRRGQYLYEGSMLCWTCHTSQGGFGPGEPQSGGREFNLTQIGPGFGYVYAKNITPDVETGIGAWSDGELVRAIREGVDREGRVIFPVMAYQFYHGLSDDDALALVAYLRSLAPVRKEVPTRRLSFVGKALITIGLIKPESPITAPVVATPPGPTAAYGEYITWHAAGCAECHTPRDPQTAALDRNRLLGGGLFQFTEEGFVTTAPNLTPDVRTSIGGWTEEQFVTAVQTGVRPDGRVLLPFMPWPSYQRWSRDDLHAVWLYLRSLPAVAHEVPASRLTGAAANGAGAARGQAIFDIYCRTCHGEKGGGGPFTNLHLAEVAPALPDDALAVFVAEGPPGSGMPGFGKTLTREQIADVIAYIRSW